MTDRLGRPTMDEVLLHVAYAFAARSTCTHAQVGCVIAHDGRIVSTGYNGAPPGMPHCDHQEWRATTPYDRPPQWLLDLMDAPHVESFAPDPNATYYRDDDYVTVVPNGGRYDGCRTAIHAEANAVAFAARYGACLAGTTLYTTLSPCLRCAGLIISVGVKRVVTGEQYRDRAGVDLLMRAEIDVTEVQDVHAR